METRESVPEFLSFEHLIEPFKLSESMNQSEEKHRLQNTAAFLSVNGMLGQLFVILSVKASGGLGPIPIQG